MLVGNGRLAIAAAYVRGKSYPVAFHVLQGLYVAFCVKDFVDQENTRRLWTPFSPGHRAVRDVVIMSDGK
jgi:hypothetical protein